MGKFEPEPIGPDNPTQASLSFIGASEALSNRSLVKTGLRVMEASVIAGVALAVAALVGVHESGLSIFDTSNPEQLRRVWGAISWIASFPAVALGEVLIKGLRAKNPKE